MADTEIVGPAVKGHRRFFVLGPPVTLLMFSNALTGTVLTDLIVYRACLFSPNTNHTECSILRTNASSSEAIDVEAQVEAHVSMIVLAKSLIESVLPAILSLFLGPWSDRAGRRPLFLSGFAGFTICYISLTFMCNWNMNPWYFLIPSLPASALGGLSAVIIASMCHIADTSAEKDRTMLLAWLQASVYTGVLFGIFTGPLIFKTSGYTAVFSTAAICCMLALLYIYFFVQETVQDTSKESIRGLFKISSVQELVSSAVEKRDGFFRPVVWLAICILALSVMVLEGEVSISFLFTRERLGWDVQRYSYFSGTAVLLSIPCMIVGVSLFSRILDFPDSLITGIALTSCLGGALTKAFATEGWHMYLSSFIGFFNGATGPVMRSTISKSVPAKDIGKVFSLTSSLETLSPLAGAPLYTLIYSHYLPPIYPSPVFLLSASFFTLLLFLTLCLAVVNRNYRNVNFAPLVEEE
ncbi:probable peptidoglycan muropeptide transporter SLC46 isoform X2 [Neodiprion pinetum]|uniref:probable peptidoglycan muropeptide transporter SLC46 isoform X2 n=1 Tax=Neodiprion pinetum TaxID=441929 RepID=UPI001EDEA959|nr:proton-coupled folate transporter-like [Neodiprion pinetum]XP_046480459.1 proton-coupled folate transporter-like [Neodiprion pinetum]XP_046480460.1 proton-coupled folate transporter-like [Neodiprion pinetum]XP_046480461.1 proton-coupled folate transporter-like [Neodiprion pinetum]XP_046480463.1 proton-coupled folate transporter-like [Neodiprion pinetum]XP_046480464.1 proton-coupled folate transporter-like [Neodiprion pinetum]